MISYLPLAKLMKEKNITFAQLKEITGRNDGALKKALCDGVYIKTGTLAVICKTLHCGISDVIEHQPGEQKGLGAARKVYADWDLLNDKLNEKGSTLTAAGVDLLDKSVNYLTVKRKRNSKILLSELRILANYLESNVEDYIIED